MKKFFIYSGVIIAILLLLYFGVSFWLVRSTAARVEAGRQAILDAGDKLYLAEYENDPIPDEENAYHFLMLAQPDLKAFDGDHAAISWQLELHRRIRPEYIEKLAAIIDKYPEMYRLLEQAVACTKYQADLNYADGLMMSLEHTFQFRYAARAFSDKALVEAYRGNGDMALKQCEHSLVLSANLSREPIMVSQLVHLTCQSIAVLTANHVLRVADTSPEARERLDKVLSAIDNRQAAIDAMKGERAFGIHTFQQLRDGTLVSEEIGEPGLSPLSSLAGTWLGQAYLNDDEAMYIELLNRQVRALEMDRARRKKEVKEAEDALAEIEENSGFRYMMTRILVPALNAFGTATDRDDARNRCLRVLLAIEGQEEVDLEQTELPDAAKTDPFTGQPLLLKRKGDAWIVYSVGENEFDDGGSFHNADGLPLDIGLAPLVEPLEDGIEFDD